MKHIQDKVSAMEARMKALEEKIDLLLRMLMQEFEEEEVELDFEDAILPEHMETSPSLSLGARPPIN